MQASHTQTFDEFDTTTSFAGVDVMSTGELSQPGWESGLDAAAVVVERIG